MARKKKMIKGIDLNEIYFSRIISAIFRRVVNIPHRISFYFPFGFSNRNRKRLLKYKNIHKGERCFIIANGPSLNKMDLSLLKDEITIGMNRIYLMENKMGFLPTYLTVFDIPIQLKQFTDEYESINVPKFYNWLSRNLFSNKEEINFFNCHFTKDFQPDFTKSIGNSRSVTAICIQLAFYMGFKEVYIVGKDHSYNIAGKGGKVVIADGSEKNHFIEGYYKPGQKWKIPSYKEEEHFYLLAKNYFEKHKRIIKDATVGGKLQVFDKIDFYSLFNNNSD